jgi:hypothetical protein
MRRPPDEYDQTEWLAFRAREIRRQRRCVLRRFIHYIGRCFQ